VRAGDTISPWYDPMIAKVIVAGPTRAVALNRLAQALRRTQVAGTVTNLAFLGALAEHAGFAAGDVDTGLIGRDLEALVRAPEVEARHVAAAAMAASGLAEPGAAAGFTLWSPLERRVALRCDGEEMRVSVRVEDATRQLWRIGEAKVLAERVGGQWQVGGQAMPAVAVAGDVVTVFDGYGLSFEVIDPLNRDSRAGGDGNLIVAPMPGLVKSVHAEVGQAVAAGDRLAVLEAMKMEHSLLAARDGVVAEVLAEAGAQVEAGAALVRLEPEDA
jgi:3-methylcrotonyl-CoA carboxylase alpha subunit